MNLTLPRGAPNAVISAGSILTLPIVPYVADILDRQTGVMTSFVVTILAVILHYIGINLSMSIAARFCIGFGAAIIHDAALLPEAELVHISSASFDLYGQIQLYLVQAQYRCCLVDVW
jgi:hypothetical protein